MDSNRQAIVDNFLIQVADDGGTLVQENIAEATGVKQGTVVYDRFDTCGDIE